MGKVNNFMKKQYKKIIGKNQLVIFENFKIRRHFDEQNNNIKIWMK